MKVTYFESNYKIQPDSNNLDDVKDGNRTGVMLQRIDQSIYEYFTSTINTRMLGCSYNPLANLQGGSLGYFSTHSSHTKIVEEKNKSKNEI